MKLNEYQNRAKTFARYTDPQYAFTNLFAEAGEVAGKIAKVERGDKVTVDQFGPINAIVHNEELRQAVKAELGDVLWQLSECCRQLSFTLEEVAQSNIDKLSGRKERGTIKGEGDNR